MLNSREGNMREYFMDMVFIEGEGETDCQPVCIKLLVNNESSENN